MLIDVNTQNQIDSFHYREDFNKMGTFYDEASNSRFIEIGRAIEYNGKKYEVTNINFRMEHTRYPARLTGNFDRNCQIGVFVKEI